MNYKEERKKAKFLCKLHGVELVWCNTVSGSYDSGEALIQTPYITSVENVTTFYHELGHYFDMRGYNSEELSVSQNARGVLNSKPLQERKGLVTRGILREEAAASLTALASHSSVDAEQLLSGYNSYAECNLDLFDDHSKEEQKIIDNFLEKVHTRIQEQAKENWMQKLNIN